MSQTEAWAYKTIRITGLFLIFIKLPTTSGAVTLTALPPYLTLHPTPQP